MKAKLILENGKIFEGKAFGYIKESLGELVFNTSSVGYQEILSNPVYLGKFVVMTYPLIGNYGVNLDDMQTNEIKVNAFIVREKSNMPNNWRCEFDLDSYLKQHKVLGIEGIDTRSLTRILRNEGSMRGIICTNNQTHSQVMEKLHNFSNIRAVDYVTVKEMVHIEGAKNTKVAVIDLGCTKSFINSLVTKQYDVTIYPAGTKASDILSSDPDMVVITNGPGNPNELAYIADEVKTIANNKKIIGIGLGSEVLAIALGAQVNKLLHGHYGLSNSIKDMETGKIIVAECNYGYSIQEDTMPADFTVTHRYINDNSIVGFKHNQLQAFGFEYEVDITLE